MGKIVFFAIVILPLVMGGCMNRTHLVKDEIIQFTIDNEALLNKAVEEIWGLEEYVSRIAHTSFSRIRPREGFDFEGLYTAGVVDSEYVRKPLDNPVLYELLKDGRIGSIGIRRPNAFQDTTYHIQFTFNVRGIWDRHGGIYFSKDDEPLLFYGEIWGNPTPYEGGWVSYGNHFYYTERIVPHWFYYEMLFNSSRTP